MIRNKGNVVVSYLEKFPDPKIPTLTIAKRMAKDHPNLFKTAEHARELLRYYRGNKGSKQRKSIKNTSPGTLRESGKSGFKFPLPPSKSETWEPIEYDYSRILVLGDLHVPYHNTVAINTAVKFGLDFKPDCILFNGDLHDCYSVSKWTKDPRLRNFPEEIKILQEFFGFIRERFKCDIVFKLGNHEERFETYMFTRAPDMVGTENWEYAKLIDAKNFGIEVVGDQRIIMLGGLPVIHGHEFSQSFYNPVNPARGLFLRGIHTAVTSHWHQTSDHVERSMLGKILTTWSTGCLCDLHPRYSRLNKWNLGFLTVITKNEDYSVENYRIYKGKVL